MKKIDRSTVQNWCCTIVAVCAVFVCIHHLQVQDWVRGFIWVCIAAAAGLSIRRR